MKLVFSETLPQVISGAKGVTPPRQAKIVVNHDLIRKWTGLCPVAEKAISAGQE